MDEARRCSLEQRGPGPVPGMIERWRKRSKRSTPLSRSELADPEVLRDQSRYAEISKAHSDLEDPHTLWPRPTCEARASLDEAEAMLDEGGLDPEMKEFLVEEKNAAREKLEALEQELRLAVLEKDPRDDKNAIVEVRAGAGGDEAALFAAEVQRMIMRYAERMRFKTDILSTTEATLGGVKEVIFEVKGRGAYGALKYESGVHRVQRVPVTESTGRIHTSTATVAVLPEVEDVEIHIDPQRRAGGRLPVHRSGRAVGQHHRLGGADSRTSPPGWSSRARTRSRSSRTRSGLSASCGPGCMTWPRPSRTPSWRRSGAARWAPATGPRRSAPTTSRKAGSPTTAWD